MNQVHIISTLCLFVTFQHMVLTRQDRDIAKNCKKKEKKRKFGRLTNEAQSGELQKQPVIGLLLVGK